MNYTRRELWDAFTAIALTLFLGSLDMAAISTALPVIGAAFNDNEHLSWVMTAYILTATVTAPIYGKLSDIYGNRRMLIIAVLGFILGVLLCACASNIYQLILFRLVQGVGGGGIMVLAFISIGRIVPSNEQGWYQGLLAGVFALAALLAPILGGVITQYLSWRWMFILYLPLGMAALILIYKSIKPVACISQDKHVDVLGAILLAIWIVDFLFLIQQFGSFSTAGLVITPKFIGLVCGVVVFLLCFILHEQRVSNPLIPLVLFKRPIFAVSILAILISSISSFAATLFLPQYFQSVLGVSPALSGLLLEPVQIGMVVGPVLAGWLVARGMSYKNCLLLGIGLVAIMYFMLAWPIDLLVISAIAIPILITLGVGLGVIMPLMTVVIQNCVDKSNIGAATATLGLARSLGSLIGVVLFGMVYSGSLGWRLIDTKLNALTIQEVLHKGGVVLGSLSGTVHAKVLAAFSDAFNIVFLLAGILAAISWCIILFMKKVDTF